MKIIKISLILIIIFVLVFLLYTFNIDKNIYYVSLDNTKIKNEKLTYSNIVANYLKRKNLLKEYVSSYSKIDKNIPDIINDINLNNKTIVNNKEIGLKQILSQADFITISIGNNELLRSIKSNLNDKDFNSIYNDANEIMKDLEELIKLIRKYNKKEFVLIGYYYEPIETSKTTNDQIENLFKYIYQKYEILENKYNINYINVNNIIKIKKNTSISTEISKQIINIIDTSIIN